MSIYLLSVTEVCQYFLYVSTLEHFSAIQRPLTTTKSPSCIDFSEYCSSYPEFRLATHIQNLSYESLETTLKRASSSLISHISYSRSFHNQYTQVYPLAFHVSCFGGVNICDSPFFVFVRRRMFGRAWLARLGLVQRGWLAVF